MGKKKKLFLFILAGLLLLTGCKEKETKDISEEKESAVNMQLLAEEAVNELVSKGEERKANQHIRFAYEPNDAYKIFYGTWKYTDIVSRHFRLGGDEGYEEMLGKKISCFPEKYITEKAMIENPFYLISIFPIEQGYNQFLGE